MSITQINTYFKVKFQNNFVFISAKLITLYVNSKNGTNFEKTLYFSLYSKNKFKYIKI